MPKPTYEELEQRIKELEELTVQGKQPKSAILPKKKAPEATKEIHLFRSLDLLNRALAAHKDEEDIIDDVLGIVFSIFGCDRIWLFHPCNPDAPTFRILAEKNNPDFPGAFISGQEISLTPQAAKTIRKALDLGKPVVFDPASGNKIDDVASRFSVLSQMIMAVHPRMGEPWMFGIHQCSHARVWTDTEQVLFREIAFRVVECLNNLILLRSLQKSEEKYRALFLSSNEGIALYDILYDDAGQPVDYRVLDANPAYENLTGIKVKDAIGALASELYGTGEPPYLDIFTSQEPVTFETTFEPLAKCMKISAFQTEKKRFATLFSDITERKLAEKRLQESKEKYHSLYSNAQVGLVRTTVSEGEILDCNHKFAKMLGYPNCEECIADWKSSERFVDGNERSKLVALLLQTGKQDNYTTQITKKDGTPIWVEFSATCSKEHGYIECVLVDITTRKQAEEKLLFTKHTVDNSSTPIIWLAPVDRCIYANDAASTLLGYSKDEMRCLPASAHHPNGTKEYWDTYLPLLKEGQAVEMKELEFRRKDGSLVPVWTHPTYLDYKGKEYILLSFYDLSEKKKMEADLRHVQKMEAIGTLAGGIAHDFNNILSAMFGYLQLAKEDRDNPELLQHDLDEVYSGAVRATDLVGQILTFSRKDEQSKEPLHMHLIVKEVLKLLRPSLPASIEIQQEVRSQAQILAAPTQVHQVLLNLCTNAYYSMRETGGTLTVSLDDFALTESDILPVPGMVPKKYIRLTVRDTGIGMSETIREKIFEPYFTTKEKGEGTGLGLAIVHGIVTSHKGSISVYSKPGKGTIVHVYLPSIAQEEDTTQFDLFQNPIAGGKEHILFVDDEERLTTLAQEVLFRYGYQVTTCRNGLQALREFTKRPNCFDLVITDMTMPAMNGLELSTRLLTLRPELPIVLCTGFSELINKENAEAAGITEYMEKPIRMSNLLRVIRKVLDA